MKEKLYKYIKENLEIEEINYMSFHEEIENNYECRKISPFYSKSVNNLEINEFVEQKDNYSDFQTLLFKMIDERNLKDSDVYNKVHIDRRLFSKIRSNLNYHPSKETIILLGLSLELNEDEIVSLLDSASYSLPKNNYFDLIIRFCFINKIYKLTKVNELLEEYNCKQFNY